jgi:hypothetical protein
VEETQVSSKMDVCDQYLDILKNRLEMMFPQGYSSGNLAKLYYCLL